MVEKYKLSFTTGGLLRNETLMVAKLFLLSCDWSIVQQRVMVENYIQLKALSSRKRIFREIRMRLEKLTVAEMKILVAGPHRDVDAMLWLAICRSYGFIGDFAKEVLYEKKLSLQCKIEFVDFNLFVEQKSVIHPELLSLTDSTTKRLRQILFSIMRNCGLIDQDGNIQTMLLSSKVSKVLKNNISEGLYFPVQPGGYGK